MKTALAEMTYILVAILVVLHRASARNSAMRAGYFNTRTPRKMYACTRVEKWPTHCFYTVASIKGTTLLTRMRMHTNSKNTLNVCVRLVRE